MINSTTSGIVQEIALVRNGLICMLLCALSKKVTI